MLEILNIYCWAPLKRILKCTHNNSGRRRGRLSCVDRSSPNDHLFVLLHRVSDKYTRSYMFCILCEVSLHCLTLNFETFKHTLLTYYKILFVQTCVKTTYYLNTVCLGCLQYHEYMFICCLKLPKPLFVCLVDQDSGSHE